MKRAIVSIVIALALSASPALADYLVGSADITRATGYYSGSGGEFTLYNINLTTAGYDATTKNIAGGPQSFQTFCVETDEYVMPPLHLEEVYVNTSGSSGSEAQLGGIDTDVGDPLDYKTAYLYTRFATGQLTGYAYSGSVGGLTRSQTAAALQRVIWSIEGEGGGDFTTNPSNIRTPLNAAQQALATSWVTEATNAAWNSIHSVRVLNLYSVSSPAVARQDMLYLVPVPGAFLLGFLGLGYAGMRLRKVA